MVLPDKVESLWIATTPGTSYPNLANNTKTDVVIVGGGIAGLNVAYFLKKKGLKVIVVEARNIALGTSGNTTAKVTSQHVLKYSYLINNFGKDKAKIYADANQWAIGKLEEIIGNEKINCDFCKTSAYTYTKKVDEVSEIKNEVATAQKLNLPASFVDHIDLIPFKIHGAIKFDNQAYFHPRKYLLALANKINDQNNHIFEQTKALDIKDGEGECEVITDKGNIKAKFVVIATNFPFYDKDNVFSTMPKTHSFVIAGKASYDQFKGVLIGTGEKDISLRHHTEHQDKWLLIGGTHQLNNKQSTDESYKHLSNESSQFNIESISYKWGAQDSNPSDRVPYIGFYPNSKRVLVTTGFGAWGMTTSFVSAKILTDLITDGKSEWEALYSPSRLKSDIRSNKNNMDSTKDKGQVIIKSGKPIAVYTDEKGVKHSVSAVCTHMGCTVGWNDKDKTWDCPCHGSRYDKFGKVINGPAPKDLPKV
ncbi:MAG: FAD-dependent oxidoreductase [Candidatus Daviesbacteria bacterium]|nr:FAD-dependent oxidoreductase [Candidatus Daviesbacteria bacterium]